MPIGKTVGTFCVLYVPAKCFLGWLGTNRCRFVPAILLAGTNRCLFVPEGEVDNPEARKERTYSGEVARITLYLFLLPMFIMFTTCSIGTVLSA